ncbi:hypothetical protein [Nitratireductor luteus]|nr:hypothetical protein [Nitratireductor luteus]
MESRLRLTVVASGNRDVWKIVGSAAAVVVANNAPTIRECACMAI